MKNVPVSITNHNGVVMKSIFMEHLLLCFQQTIFHLFQEFFHVFFGHSAIRYAAKLSIIPNKKNISAIKKHR